MKPIRAIIADDEEQLRGLLHRKLASRWPELEIVAEAGDGEQALGLLRDLRPDIAFLDIRMPGMSGIDVAKQALGTSLFVFVTAYDKYAVAAFENEAVDYILKPVSDDRLKKTITRLKARLAVDRPLADISAVLEKVSQKLKQAPEHLQWIKAQQKDGVRLVPVADIFYFKATDKYTTLRTRDAELLIRKSLGDLEKELDPELFWRVHRSAIVNVRQIHAVSRAVAGTGSIKFKDIPDRIAVSRQYGHLFRQM